MTEERFLITGALGCIGAWSCAELVREDVPVILYDLGTKRSRLELVMSPEEIEQLTLVHGDVTPANLNANAVGWKRVHVLDATTGDPDTSLLLQKLLGPPAGFGARMPFNRRPLDRAVIDVVELWIAAGAPATGWVPGTD